MVIYAIYIVTMFMLGLLVFFLILSLYLALQADGEVPESQTEIKRKPLEVEDEKCGLEENEPEARLIAILSNFGDPLIFTRIIWNATKGMERRVKLNRTEFRCLVEDPYGDVMAFYGSREDLTLIKNRLEEEKVDCKFYFSSLTNF